MTIFKREDMPFWRFYAKENFEESSKILKIAKENVGILPTSGLKV